MNTQAQSATLADGPVVAVMSQPVVAIHEDDTLDRGLQAFAVASLHHVAIVTADGRCAGLLSDRTVAAAWLHYPMEFDRLRAGHVLTDTQPLVRSNATVREAARMMHRCGTDAVVVVDQRERPVGVLTAGDLVALLAKPATRQPDSQEPPAGQEPAEPVVRTVVIDLVD
jgi:CBS domain-containing protein